MCTEPSGWLSRERWQNRQRQCAGNRRAAPRPLAAAAYHKHAAAPGPFLQHQSQRLGKFHGVARAARGSAILAVRGRGACRRLLRRLLHLRPRTQRIKLGRPLLLLQKRLCRAWPLQATARSGAGGGKQCGASDWQGLHGRLVNKNQVGKFNKLTGREQGVQLGAICGVGGTAGSLTNADAPFMLCLKECLSPKKLYKS